MERDGLVTDRYQLTEERDQLTEERAKLTIERDGLVSELAGAQNQNADLQRELGETRSQVQQLDTWNKHNEARAEKALAKIKSDGDALAKSKRAMAIALTLLADLETHEDSGPPADTSEDHSTAE